MTAASLQRRMQPARVVSDPEVMGGWPCVSGTRVPARTIVIEIRAGTTDEEIFDHYPSLPVDGIDAVRAWAKAHNISLEPECSNSSSMNV